MALPPFLKFLEADDPDFGQAIEKVVSSAMTPGALDEKTKLLIALALDAAHGSVPGVTSVARQARSAGATDAEIAEALRLAYFASGNSILMASSAAFRKNE
ncbi:carboxymuconolactone decarboxylase family protein [Desulfosporosinus sp. OT]|uniref:carboxymuconolactone decarboxylase family protein n=1 Tax=Desulfosporosinus sp. OT TaxID=913865 RepID=UPI000223A447|nr:carboxymuconolactone decarboxylase family protein [Desulfosporosinus sp. OT]EGW39191.1 alkylhydroperoxidase AhpD family core domain protein [Desulfosporosinus sp. OT]